MKKLIVFIDMDGTAFNFSKGVGRFPHEWDPPEMFEPDFYRNLALMPGAREAITALLKEDLIDLYIATKPTMKKPFRYDGRNHYRCASEKVGSIADHLPELLNKMIIICDKTLLRGDVLIDDDLRWKEGFQGEFYHFQEREPEKCWAEITKKLLERVAHMRDIHNKYLAAQLKTNSFFEKGIACMCTCNEKSCVC